MKYRAWTYLLAAVVAEIIGITCMKLVADDDSWLATAFTYGMIGLSFYLLATAVKVLPIAMTYATWETIGLVSITLISFLFFGEQIGAQKLVGMLILICGVVMVNFGAPKVAKE
jgi:multidrug transporter EmrE-like cation transporter